MIARVRFGITAKFVLVAGLIVALSSTLWGWWAWNGEKRLLYSQLDGKGRLMMTSLATPIINALLYEEMGVIEEGGLLDNFVEEIMNNPDFPAVYAFVTDKSGRILAHNEYADYGKSYSDPLTLAAIGSRSFRSAFVEKNPGHGSILDMAMPLSIHGKLWGTLRVGVSTAPLEAQLAALSRRIITFACTFFLIGSCIVYLVGSSLVRPIKRLAHFMDRVDADNLIPPLSASERSDEIGLLERNFMKMLQRLQQSEEERQKAMAHVVQSEKLVTVGKLVAGVAHEVNNPLSGMTTCIHNLEENPGEMLKYTGLIRKGLSRVEAIVRDLLNFSRAGEIMLQAVASDHFFEEAATFAKLAMKERNVVLSSADTCSPPITFRVDKGKLHQVLLNLLFNAADASPPGGKVTMWAYQGEGDYCIAFQDEGAGIPKEERQKIFEIFYTTKHPGKGNGMGLAISKSIVEMHGGSIMLDCREGSTTFIVRIPIVQER